MSEHATELRLVATGGPCDGMVIPCTPHAREVVIPYHSRFNDETFMVRYDITPDGLIWRDWKRSKEMRK